MDSLLWVNQASIWALQQKPSEYLDLSYGQQYKGVNEQKPQHGTVKKWFQGHFTKQTLAQLEGSKVYNLQARRWLQILADKAVFWVSLAHHTIRPL